MIQVLFFVALSSLLPACSLYVGVFFCLHVVCFLLFCLGKGQTILSREVYQRDDTLMLVWHGDEVL
jgi:hypothetical protein